MTDPQRVRDGSTITTTTERPTRYTHTHQHDSDTVRNDDAVKFKVVDSGVVKIQGCIHSATTSVGNRKTRIRSDDMPPPGAGQRLVRW